MIQVQFLVVKSIVNNNEVTIVYIQQLSALKMRIIYKNFHTILNGDRKLNKIKVRQEI